MLSVSTGKFIGYAYGDRDPEIVNIKNWLRPRFSYAKLPTPLDKSDLFDERLRDVVRTARAKSGLSNIGEKDGLWNYDLKIAIKYFVPAPTLVNCFLLAGTWAGPDDGPPAWVMDWVDKTRYRKVGVWYAASGFLTPDPNTSYNESVQDGVEKAVAAILNTPGPIVLIGYSQGAEVVIRVTYEFLPGGRLHHRLGDLKRVITFGNPCRPPGPDIFGRTFDGFGISGIFPPPELRAIRPPIFIDYGFPQDMYANSTPLIREFYKILTAMELSLDFFQVLLQLLGSTVGTVFGGAAGNVLLGGLLTGLFGAGVSKRTTPQVIAAVAPYATSDQKNMIQMALSNPVDVIHSLQRLMEFASTSAHFRYGGPDAFLDFNGTDAVRDAAAGLNGARFV